MNLSKNLAMQILLPIQVLLVFLALSGCSGEGSNEKLTSENIHTIEVGMDQAAVGEILGGAEPYKIVKTPKGESTTHYFKGKRMSATVLYVDKKVATVMLNGVQVAN